MSFSAILIFLRSHLYLTDKRQLKLCFLEVGEDLVIALNGLQKVDTFQIGEGP